MDSIDKTKQVDNENNSEGSVLEMYKLFVGTAERITQQRSVANSFFLTLHTGLFGLTNPKLQ